MTNRELNLALKKKSKPKTMTEHHEQKAVFDWAFGNLTKFYTGVKGKYKWDRPYIGACIKYPELLTMYPVPNAAKRGPAVAMYMKSEGLRSGVPDICLPIKKGNWNSLYVEMKTSKGRLSKEQEWWHKKLMEHNNLVLVERSANEAIKKIEAYLNYKIKDFL